MKILQFFIANITIAVAFMFWGCRHNVEDEYNIYLQGMDKILECSFDTAQLNNNKIRKISLKYLKNDTVYSTNILVGLKSNGKVDSIYLKNNNSIFMAFGGRFKPMANEVCNAGCSESCQELIDWKSGQRYRICTCVCPVK